MRISRIIVTVAALTLLTGLAAPYEMAHSQGRVRSPRPSSEHAARAYGQLPLAFEANLGQSDRRVRFISRGCGYGLFLTPTEAVLALSTPTRGATLRVSLAGADADPQVTGTDELPGKVNYFLGDDPAKWRTDVPTYAGVRYEDVYPGVDMVYYGNQRELEYDLIVAPGADAGAIALSFDGSEALSLDARGDLSLKLGGGAVVMRRPYLYQDIEGVRREVEGGYILKGSRRVGFRVGDYDRTRPLVIDPVLIYSTYLGGGLGDQGIRIAVDGAGNAYVTGNTFSPNFPPLNSAQSASGGGPEAFVSKLNPSGSALVYSTYLGGSGQDFGYAVAVDGGGNACVTGVTDSTNFPTANPFQASYGGGPDDGFVAKLNAAGNALLYSTYLGGSHYDRARGVAVNAAGNAYVTGDTGSANFPKVNPAQATHTGWEAFVLEFNTTGSALVYSTFLGGSNYDYGFDVALDGAGNAYITGWTLSTNFPTVNPAQPANAGGGGDAFLAKLNPSGSAFIYATYLGGSGEEYGRGIAVDGAGNAYVTGTTKSTNFPTAAPFQAAQGGGLVDAFVAKLNPSGNAFTYSTYLGGSAQDAGYGIAVDGAGQAYVTGETSSPNFPAVSPLQAYGGGVGDAFITTFNAAGNALAFSTYMGGAGFDRGSGIALDGAGSVYVTGATDSANFPTVAPYQPAPAGAQDAFVAKFATKPPCVDPPNTTMVAWYPFDETAGTAAANLATGNTGTLTNSPTHIPGKVAGALRFDGVNDYVDSPSSIVTDFGPAGLPQTCSGIYSTCRGDFSIDAWIKVHPNAAGVVTVVEKRSGAVPAIKGYSFFVFQQNKLGLQLADGAGALGYTNYLSPAVAGLTTNWHHVAVTVSRRASPAGIRWYYDGGNVGSSDPTVTTTSRFGSLVNNNALRVGASSTGGNWYRGDIDELEIFNRELTPAEVKAIFDAAASGKCKP